MIRTDSVPAAVERARRLSPPARYAAVVDGAPAEAFPWAKKIEQPGAMDLIGVDGVTWELDRLMATFDANRRAA